MASLVGASATEASTLVFQVVLEHPVAHDVEVTLTSDNLSAKARKDFWPFDGGVTVPAGDDRAWVGVATIADGVPGGDEVMRLRMTDISGAVTGAVGAIGTISDQNRPAVAAGLRLSTTTLDLDSTSSKGRFVIVGGES